MKDILRLLSVFILLLFVCCKSNTVRISDKTEDKTKDSLAFMLCQIYGFDQGIRDFNLKHKDFKMVPRIDTLNFNKIVEFVKINGYPTKILLGENYLKQECVDAAVGVVLLHNPHRLVNEIEYFNLFLNEVKKGNLKPETFAFFLDKYYWTSSKNKVNRRVFYGSNFGKPCIQTKDATNKARIEIGLKALKDEEFVDCAGEVLDMPKIRK